VTDDPEQPDAEGRTLLHHAVARRDAAAVKALLERGADYERNDHAGHPPTHAMFDETWSFDRWVSFELKRGFKAVHAAFLEFVHDPRCAGSLTFVNQQLLYNGIIDGSFAAVKSALEEGGVTNLDIRLADGTTPLHLAAKRGEARIVKELLAHRADPFARDRAGNTPLDLATAAGHAAVAAVLGARPSKSRSKSKPKSKPKRRAAARTLLGKLEDTIVAEVVRAVHDVYALEGYTGRLDSILLVGDEVSCSAVFLDVPGLRDMKRIDESGGFRVEGRFITEDDACLVEEQSGLAIRHGVRLLMYRVAARLEHDPGLWDDLRGTRAVHAVYVDHAMTDIVASWRQLANQLVAKPVERYLHAVDREQAESTAPSSSTAKNPRRA